MLLVTGITGHSGRYLIHELMVHNYQDTIRCTVRIDSDTSALDESGLKIEKIVGDLHDPSFVDAAMKGIETVIHIAGIEMTPNVVEATLKNSVCRLIMVHTTGIYSKYKSASESYKKIESDMVAKTSAACQSQLRVTILRPTMIYGDMCDQTISTFIRMAAHFPIVPVINRGDCLIQPVNARDLGRAYYQVLMTEETAGNDYDLSGRDVVTIREMLDFINKGLNKNNRYINVPVGLGVSFAKILCKLTFDRLDYVEKVQRMVEDRCFSSQRAQEDFDYNPMSFFEGLETQLKEYVSGSKT